MTTLDITPNLTQPMVDSLVSELVSANHWPDCSFINLPMIFPGGGNVTVKITPISGGFRISDGGFAYREAENFGREDDFARIAKNVVDQSELEKNSRAVFVDAAFDEVYAAVCDVAAASFKIATSLCLSQNDAEEDGSNETLTERLISIFGKGSVEKKPKLIGASTNPWPVTALVRYRDRQAAFQMVAGSTYSIYRTSSAFADISDLEDAPSLIAVVPSIASLGTKLGLLSRTARVIENNEPDAVYLKNAA